MYRLLLCLLLLSGCDLFRREPVVVLVPVALDCPYFIALAGVIVDRRRLGQSRAEQTVIVDRGPPPTDAHLALVDAIYDWPRPTNPGQWALLRTTAVEAARLHCTVMPHPGGGSASEVLRPLVLARPPLTSK